MNVCDFQHITSPPVESTVYKNVERFCAHNHIRVVDGGGYDEERTKKTIDVQSFIKITATIRNESLGGMVPFYIFIFGQKSTTINKNAFGSKADDIASVMGPIKDKKAVIMFISERSFKTNVTKAVENQKKKKGAEFLIYSVVHDVFKVDLITDASIKHEIMTEAEAAVIKKDYEKNESLIPIISTGDPRVVWMMGMPGQMVKITHPSIITGSTVYYRVIK